MSVLRGRHPTSDTQHRFTELQVCGMANHREQLGLRPWTQYIDTPALKHIPELAVNLCIGYSMYC